MDDSADDQRPHRTRASDERGNPFVTFSRFVDQQLSSLFKTFTDFRSSRSPSMSDCCNPDEYQRRRREAYAEPEQVERSFHEAFAPRYKSPPPTSVIWENTFPDQAERPGGDKEPTDRLQEALGSWRQQNLQDRVRKGGDLKKEYDEADQVMDCIQRRICQLFPLEEKVQESRSPDSRCPYRPVDSDLDKKFRHPFKESFLPTLEWASPKSCSSNYVTDSSYSPINLENEDSINAHRVAWKRAFEDLLLLPDGKDVSENATRAPVSDARDDAPTELELYERFLGSYSPHIITNTSVHEFASNSIKQTASDKPSLISTLTTTERKKLADDGVYTQVVLKKRFSDGREESTETEHTAHGSLRPTTTTEQQSQIAEVITPASTPSLGHDGKIKQALGQRIGEQKKPGWFWS